MYQLKRPSPIWVALLLVFFIAVALIYLNSYTQKSTLEVISSHQREMLNDLEKWAYTQTGGVIRKGFDQQYPGTSWSGAEEYTRQMAFCSFAINPTNNSWVFIWGNPDKVEYRWVDKSTGTPLRILQSGLATLYELNDSGWIDMEVKTEFDQWEKVYSIKIDYGYVVEIESGGNLYSSQVGEWIGDNQILALITSEWPESTILELLK